MSNKKIRIGFIGLNPDSHWAARAHFPALQYLTEEFEVKGVANSTYESSQKAAAVLHIPLAFANARALIESAEIDLVVVTVKVTHHFALVEAALEAGKHVYCEHPLGNGWEKTQQLTELAASKDVVAVVGTQMAVAPEVIYLQQLIEEGYLGKVLSTTLIGSGEAGEEETVADLYYLYDKSFGATMLTIPLAHTLAGLTKVLGGFKVLTSRMNNHFTTVRIKDTGEVKKKTAEDQIMVMGTLQNEASIAIHYRGGISKGTNLLWEINGTEGDIQVSGALGHGQLVQLSIYGARGEEKELTPLIPPAEMYSGLPDNPTVRNVVQVYKLLAGDIRNNTRNAPSFRDAMRLQELVDSIETSSNNEKA